MEIVTVRKWELDSSQSSTSVFMKLITRHFEISSLNLT